MRKRFALASSVLTLVLIVAGACASGSTATQNTAAVADGPAMTQSIVVDNGLQGLVSLTIYITQESGGRRLLGPVESGKKATFTYEAAPGVYQLTARGGGQHEILSEKFRVDAAGSMTWRLPSNNLVRN
jgi:hypothetical protein